MNSKPTVPPGLPQKAYLVHQPHGRGHVVAFADGLNLLLLNAVLLTAGR